ncbi:MAG TPA: alpha/beta hydrolase-fold protein [Ferruginibacter sp.]|jgi:esterase/lipase superfamily enzyme|nr:esterase [Chitinophagaceae bacterium]HML56771.1 alpha/beta hydrolase-fold protein [Ferruginibacter sp.]HRN92793.1 alpha/beta hydrolase-fold protein [Ferruginibacter sp.]HRO06444.1 alpha/beta hydrolase-fold protein [Ferruginibacter sp.]HRO96665.1 alpha/beta hydrolase-fold protein [Ferruginibacter sp.]
MNKETTQWYSPALGCEMPIVSYGHYGFALLLVPTAAADYLEYERFQLMESLKPYIDGGKVKVYSINSINNESWLNNNMAGEHKAIRHNQFNEYVFNEVVPFIRNNTSPDTEIITCGASFGALHSMNLFLKRPDIINGVIAMSGVYDLTEYSKGFFDDQVYINSPAHYIPNLTNDWYLQHIRKSRHIHILTGSGDYEDPEASRRFSGILNAKAIPHTLDIWGPEWKHDWPTWRAMLPLYLEHHF